MNSKSKNLRDKIFVKYSNFYKKVLELILKNNLTRWFTIITPVILLILSAIILVPKLGFEIFPSSHNNSININITAPENFTPSNMQEEIMFIEKMFSNSKEVKDYTLSISGNKITSALNLTSLIDRQNN
jgi:multidrug efflux pump subunit AcrB